MIGVVYVYIYVKKKNWWQAVTHMHLRMFNPKDCFQEKIEDLICCEDVRFMMRSREETLNIHGWSCSLKV